MWPEDYKFNAIKRAIRNIHEPHQTVLRKVALAHHCKNTHELYETLRKLYHKETDSKVQRKYRNAAAALQATGLV